MAARKHVGYVARFLVAMVLGLPLALFTAMVCTPLLWRLETVLHMELAGHSGPSDWIIVLIWAMATILLFALLTLLVSKTPKPSADEL